MTERKRFKLHEVRAAVGCAIAEGKSEVVVPDKGVLLMTWHPLSRLAPMTEMDGFPLESETED